MGERRDHVGDARPLRVIGGGRDHRLEGDVGAVRQVERAGWQRLKSAAQARQRANMVDGVEATSIPFRVEQEVEIVQRDDALNSSLYQGARGDRMVRDAAAEANTQPWQSELFPQLCAPT